MKITVVQMSYLVAGKFVSLSVKREGEDDFALYMDGVPVEFYSSVFEAVENGMWLAENTLDQDPMGPPDSEGNPRRWP